MALREGGDGGGGAKDGGAAGGRSGTQNRDGARLGKGDFWECIGRGKGVKEGVE